MNKGIAIVGILLAFLAGAGLMWGVARSGSVQPSAASLDAPRGRSAASSPIPITEEDPSWGSADAPVTIVELSDFECPFCARVTPTVARIEKEYGPDRVRVVWKHYPLGSHPNARATAEAAAAVRRLGGDFWKFHDLAFASQKELSVENRARWAQAAGVERAPFEAELRSGRPAAKVDRDIALARQVVTRGTPHFRVNGKPLSGAQPFDSFKQLIDEQLAAADALAKSGVPRAQVSLELTRKNFAPVGAEPAAKKAPPPEDTTHWRVPVSNDDPSKGPSDALVTIVELSDFECPFCSRVVPTLHKLEQEYAADLRIVWQDNPMAAHRRARPAAYFAHHARAKLGNAGFWAAHDGLFENQKALDDAGLEALAQKLGLSWSDAERAITSGRYASKVDDGIALARDFAAAGTPHFFINGRRLVGALPYERFKTIVDAELAVARGLVKQGLRRDRVYAELMKSAQPPAEPEKKKVPAPTASNPFKGAANGPVTIQVFSDFQCPFCSRVNATMAQVLSAYPREVKLVWRHLPMSFHAEAALAAEAAQEAFAQAGNEGFWRYHDRLFQNQKALQRPELERHAAESGLDLGRFKAALDARTHRAQVERDAEVARQAGISATPGFTINGYFVSGAYPFEEYDRLIQRALAAR